MARAVADAEEGDVSAAAVVGALSRTLTGGALYFAWQWRPRRRSQVMGIWWR